ncbi:MAG: sensor histidine kinase [Bacteroidales bacterium]|nr:sensor histidine kinase [Bacteroidales bacterium]
MLLKRTILGIIFIINLQLFSQDINWKTIPVPKHIPSKITNQKAIWNQTDLNPSAYYTSETYLNNKAIFRTKIKAKISDAVVYEKFPLEIAQEIKVEQNLLFKDISTLNIKYFDIAHGLFTNQIFDITEGPNGIMYFLSDIGLAVYTGNVFKIYKTNANFDLSKGITLFADSKFRIWIASEKGVAYIKDNSIYIPKNIEKDYTWNITEDKFANIWLSTRSKGICKIENDKVYYYYDKKFIKESFHTFIDNKGTNWWALSDGIAYIRNDSLFQFHLDYETYSPRYFYQYNDELWIGTFIGGIQKIKNDSLFIVDALSDQRSVYKIMSDHRGLWFSSYGNGIRLITKDHRVIPFGVEEGLSNRYPISFHIDQFSNIWVPDPYGGFSRIDNNILIYSPQNEGYASIKNISKNGDAIWYFYTGDKLRITEYGKTYSVINEGSKNIPTSKFMTDGVIVANREAWLSNYNFGLIHLKNDSMYYYNTDETYYANSAFNLQLDNKNRIWYRNRINKIRYLKNDSIYCFENTLFNNYVFKDIIKGLQTGFIYFLNDSNLFVINDQFYTKLHFNVNIKTIFEDNKGLLWVFSDSDVRVLNKLKQKKYFKSKLFEQTNINSVEMLEDNRFLVATSKGLYDIVFEDSLFSYKLFDQSSGLALNSISLVKKIDDKIYVCSDNKIYYYDSLLENLNNTKPILLIDKIKLDTEPTNGTKLNARQDQNIEFLFNIINWGKKSNLRYRLYKQKDESKWQKLNTNQISFSALTYGNYTLDVQVISDGANSKIYTFKFEVEPYFYQNTWFVFILILFAGTLVFLYIKYRIRKSEKAQIKLEKIVDEKTHQLNDEKLEVSKQLAEKELLLKEVNHRVKNNMQMVSSILELQQQNPNSLKSKDILKEANNRINALSMAHQTMYKDEQYQNVDAGKYIGIIVSNLIKSETIIADISIPEDFKLEIEKAQALGFITNELITNSIKYAWPNNNSEKIITIHLILDINSNNITFKYSDNGLGYPQSFKIEDTNTLGSILIKSFCERQLNGNLYLSNNSGAITEINFKYEPV